MYISHNQTRLHQIDSLLNLQELRHSGSMVRTDIANANVQQQSSDEDGGFQSSTIGLVRDISLTKPTETFKVLKSIIMKKPTRSTKNYCKNV